MTASQHRMLFAALTLALAVPGLKVQGQVTSAPSDPSIQAPVVPAASPVAPSLSPSPASVSPAVQLLRNFKESDIKFSLQRFMSTLRDGRHEGWVLAAYPDPKTSRPLIGAGVSLDLEERPHPQRDPLNSHPFIEPSSAQLWEATGLEPDRLKSILSQFDDNMQSWGKKNFQRKIRAHALTSDITNEEANALLRTAAVQAIENAKAYCRNFDQLNGDQQMALSHLVYQMGVNLEEFVRFLTTINRDQDSDDRDFSEDPRWKTAQRMLMDSQWAKLYSGRASTVIAMFDPHYADNPEGTVRRVALTIHPAKHRHGAKSARLLRAKAEVHRGGKHAPHSAHKKNARLSKRKLT